MSLIDCHPHKELGSFMGHAVYLALEDFEYYNYFVTKNNIIWRDDSSSNPVIINLRACIHEAIEGRIWDLEPDNIMDQIMAAGEPESYKLKRSGFSWMESPNYRTIHAIWQDYVKLVGPDEAGHFDLFAMETLGNLIIRKYPELLTDKESQDVAKYTMRENLDYPLGTEGPFIPSSQT